LGNSQYPKEPLEGFPKVVEASESLQSQSDVILRNCFLSFWSKFSGKTGRRKEEEGNAIGEDRPKEKVRYRRWCQKEHNEDQSAITIVAWIREPRF
jgi:hypothetical protein